MTLQTWIIEPRDSLIVRDGKPFGGSITHAVSLDFPFPSTTTGGVRTRAGLDSTTGIFTADPKDVKDIEVRGSLLAEIKDDEIVEFYLPAPADALLLQKPEQKEKNEAQLFRLLPLNLPNSLNNLSDLFPVGLNRTDKKDKPYGDLKFWNWRILKKWLSEGVGEREFIKVENLENYGIGNLQKDTRTHVEINSNFASEDGALFQTRGLEFNYGKDLTDARKFALVVFVDETNGKKIEDKGKLAPLGGERRLVSWRKSEKTHLICPDEIKTRIIEEKHCRLMLLTPAYFENGMPQSNDDYEIKAVACNRYQTVSGWDFAFTKTENGRTIYGQPKPTRRLLPAGSILFLKLKTDAETFVENAWFQCIGDNTQAKMDGFGLSILGTWDGEPLTEWR